MADPKLPPHPPRQAKHPGRRQPAPHLRPAHEQVMKRPNEHIHLARHVMHGHHPKKTP